MSSLSEPNLDTQISAGSNCARILLITIKVPAVCSEKRIVTSAELVYICSLKIGNPFLAGSHELLDWKGLFLVLPALLPVV